MDIAEKPRSAFWRYIGDNAAQFAGLLTVAFAILSFFLTQRATQRQQSEAQLSETLNRFGDEKSATLRATSAGMLRLLATRSARQHFLVVVDQLSTGLRIERDPQVIQVIEQDLQALSNVDAPAVFNATTKRYDSMTPSDLTEGMALLLGTVYAKELSHWLTSTNRGSGPPAVIELALRQMSNASGVDFVDLFGQIWKDRELYLSIAMKVPDLPVRVEDFFMAQSSINAFKFRTGAFVRLIQDLERRADSMDTSSILRRLVDARNDLMQLNLADKDKSRLDSESIVRLCDRIIELSRDNPPRANRSELCSATLNKARALVQINQEDQALKILNHMIGEHIGSNEPSVRWRIAQALQLLTKVYTRMGQDNKARLAEKRLLDDFGQDDHSRIAGIVSEARNHIAMLASTQE